MLKLGTLVTSNFFKETHSFRYSINTDTVLYYHLTGEDSKQSLLDNLQHLSLVILIIEKWFRQTHSVYYSMKIDMFMFYYLNNEKVDTFCYLIFYVKFGYFWLLKICWNRHDVLAIPLLIMQFCYFIQPKYKVDTMCKLIYCVKVGYFRHLKMF